MLSIHKNQNFFDIVFLDNNKKRSLSVCSKRSNHSNNFCDNSFDDIIVETKNEFSEKQKKITELFLNTNQKLILQHCVSHNVSTEINKHKFFKHHIFQNKRIKENFIIYFDFFSIYQFSEMSTLVLNIQQEKKLITQINNTFQKCLLMHQKNFIMYIKNLLNENLLLHKVEKKKQYAIRKKQIIDNLKLDVYKTYDKNNKMHIALIFLVLYQYLLRLLKKELILESLIKQKINLLEYIKFLQLTKLYNILEKLIKYQIFHCLKLR